MSSPLRVGLIGAGRIAQKHLAVFHAHPHVFSLAAVCDTNPAAAQAVADAFHLPPSCVFSDYSSMLKNIPLDVADICTLHNQHHPHALAAFDCSLHVLLEKPMAVTPQQCLDIVAAASAARRTLMIAHNQRFKANYRALKNAIHAGDLGKIHVARAESQMNVLTSTHPSHWVYDGALAGGGVAISLGLHRIDLLRFLCGPFARVLSATCRTYNSRFHNGAEDHCIATLEFTHGGIAEIFATYTPFRAPWGESFVIYGEKGTAHAHPYRVKYNDPILLASEKHPASEDPKGPFAFTPLPPDSTGLPTGDMYADELLHFAHCVRTGEEPISSGKEILHTMHALFAIYESARTQRPVEIPPPPAS